MRRLTALILSIAFILQSTSSAAAATAASTVPGASVLSALVQHIDEARGAFSNSYVGALLTGSVSRYSAAHDTSPDFSLLAHRPRMNPDALRAGHTETDVRPATGIPVTLQGVYVRPPAIAALHGSSQTQALKLKAFIAATSGAKPSAGFRGASVDTSVPSITGVEQWHQYVGGDIPGSGKWMANVASGNVIVEGDDLDIPERGIGLAFRRVYDSASGHDYVPSDGATIGLYGEGWSNNLDEHLGYDPARNVISYYNTEQARADFSWSGSSWVAPPGVNEALSPDGFCGYWLTKKNGTMAHFVAPDHSLVPSCPYTAAYAGYFGRVIAIYGRNQNNNLQFTYQWDGGDASTAKHLAKLTVQHSDGQALVLQFADVNALRVLTSITRPDGKVLRYGYDSGAELTDVCTPGNGDLDLSPGAAAICGDTTHRHHRYGYNGAANVHQISWADSPNWTMNWGSAVSGYVSFNYDSSNRAIAIDAIGIMNFTPSDGTGQALQTGASGYQLYRETGFAYAPSLTTVTDTDGHAAKFTFDAQGRVTMRQAYVSSTSTYLVSQASWDSQNNLIASVDARGNETDMAYDAWGNTIAIGLPAVTTNVGRFRPTSLYSYDVEHDAGGNPFTFNNITAYCDPVFTNLHTGSDWTTAPAPSDTLCPAVSGTQRYQYTPSTNEPFGMLTDTYSASDYHDHFSYDTSGASGDAGLPTSVMGAGFPQLDLTTETPSQGFQYDTYGNVIAYTTLSGTVATTGASRNAWVLTYDGLNRLKVASDPDGTGAQPDNHSSFTYYNDDGSRSQTETPYQHSLSKGSTYSYDADGDLIRANGYVGGTYGVGTDPSLPTTTVETDKYYDGADRLVEVVQPPDAGDVYQGPGGTTKPSWFTRYIYDLTQNGTLGTNSIEGTPVAAHGNVYKTQEYEPSNSGSLSATYAFGSAPVKQSESAFYDTKGTGFDSLDRATTRYYHSFTGTPAHEVLVHDSDTYDDPTAIGLLYQHCNPMNQCSSQSYNELGEISAITFNGSDTANRSMIYDPDGRSVSTSSTSYGAQTYSYDADGNVLSTSEPTSGAAGWVGASITYHYYPNGTRESLDVASSTFNQAGLFGYSYTADGRLQQQDVNLPSNPLVGKTSLVFAYSASGRVLTRTESGPGANATASHFAYSPSGLLKQIAYPAGTYDNVEYDASGQVLGETGGIASATRTYTYTSRGEVSTTVPGLGSPSTDSFYANGIGLSVASNMGAGSSVQAAWEPKMGAMLENSTSDPSAQTSTNAQYSYDAAGRNVFESLELVDDVHGTDTTNSATRTYDADNHLIMQLSTFSVQAYKWGPNGHPFQIGSSPDTNPSNLSYDSIHWDGDQVLFTTNSSGQVDDIKIGSSGDITPLDTRYTGVTFLDRDLGGAVGYCHNASGYAGTGAADPYNRKTKFVGVRVGPCLGSSHGTMPTSLTWWGDSLSPGATSNVGQGGLIGMPRTDGISDGMNTIQGARTYDSTLGSWTTPDPYAGDARDPASQKSYVWNGNNPISYTDPSGFDPTPPGVFMPPSAVPRPPDTDPVFANPWQPDDYEKIVTLGGLGVGWGAGFAIGEGLTAGGATIGFLVALGWMEMTHMPASGWYIQMNVHPSADRVIACQTYAQWVAPAGNSGKDFQQLTTFYRDGTWTSITIYKDPKMKTVRQSGRYMGVMFPMQEDASNGVYGTEGGIEAESGTTLSSSLTNDNGHMAW